MYISIGFTPKEVAVITKTADSIKEAMAMILNYKESVSLSNLVHKDTIFYETEPQSNGGLVIYVRVTNVRTDWLNKFFALVDESIALYNYDGTIRTCRYIYY
jgi:hypothetical protein